MALASSVYGQFLRSARTPFSVRVLPSGLPPTGPSHDAQTGSIDDEVNRLGPGQTV